MNKATFKTMCKTIVTLCLAAALLITSVLPASAAAKGYSFKYNGVSITINSNASSFIKKAGKATISRAKSCAHKGEDVTYKYSSFTLKTYSEKKGGTEYVQEIKLTSSKVSTPEGLKIGSSETDVTKKYGKAAAKFGVYTYTKGNTKLLITVSNKKVTAISYASK
jgi:hypothetical protein